MTPDEKLLLFILGIFYFSVSLAGVFFSIYLFRLGGFTAVATYYLIALITITVTSIFSGFLLQVISAKNLLRIGLLFFSMLFLALFILKQDTSHFLIALGILGGLANGTFWSGNNIMQYAFTKTHTRNAFFGYFGFLSDAAATLAPIISGLLIFMGTKLINFQFGYSLVFSLVGILMLCIAIVSRSLPVLSRVEFKISHLFSSCPFSWKIILIQQFFMGLWDTSLWTLTGVLLYAILKAEIPVGIAAGIGTTITALGALGAGKL
ncbi:MAG TPA: MFS transporter, partial [Candidatus Saccharimonadales bacterium]|nr:MFS transporter [Candidatus Saccharimonadales bacterium]